MEESNHNIDKNNDLTPDINNLQKIAISTLIQMLIYIQKRGGLNIFQAREASDCIDLFMSHTTKDVTETEQYTAIKKIIELINTGQSNGVIELREAKIIANIFDFFSSDLSKDISKFNISDFSIVN